MELLTLEERYESFGKPQDWQGVPELSYIYDMDGLFNWGDGYDQNPALTRLSLFILP